MSTPSLNLHIAMELIGFPFGLPLIITVRVLVVMGENSSLPWPKLLEISVSYEEGREISSLERYWGNRVRGKEEERGR